MRKEEERAGDGRVLAKLHCKGMRPHEPAMTDSKQLKLIVVNSLVAPEGADRAALERAEQARSMRIRLLEDASAPDWDEVFTASPDRKHARQRAGKHMHPVQTRRRFAC